MSRLPPWIVIVAVWAAIYLPALGSFEIKGEEGRRILPAIGMLESGNYLQPRVGSDTYFTKPPLVNWLVAASIRLTGIRSEWTVRLPSVLSVLVVAVAFITVGRASLGSTGSILAALVWLTTIGVIEKGRLIEIEAVYVSLCALAMICWMSWWLAGGSPWLTWVVPWIWLGLGWLAKGPVHLLFFYALVLAVLWQRNQLKALLHPAHLLGVLIMVGMFVAWAIPFVQSSGQTRALTKWSGQFTGRVTPHYFSVRSAAWTLVRAVGQFLPWIIFTPFLRLGRFEDPNERQLAKAIIWSVAVPLLAVSLLPVSAPRYSLPVAASFCWLLALAFTRDAFMPMSWSSARHRTWWQAVGQWVVVIVLASTLIGFPIFSRFAKQREKVKTIAGQINSIVPETETLYAVDPGYQPFLFYMHCPIKYVNRVDEVPSGAHYFVTRPDNEDEAARAEQWSPRRATVISRLTDYRDVRILLYQIE